VRLNLPISVDSAEASDTVWLLQGSRLITDWESRYPGETALAPLEKRNQSRIAQRLRDLSQMYGLASREMSLVAVVNRAGGRPGQLPETQVVPVGMPQDTAFAAYFGSSVIDLRSSAPAMFARPLGEAALRRPSYSPRIQFAISESPLEAFATPSAEEDLLALALSLDPDGGMQGDTPENRAATSIAALFAFLEHGHTSSIGSFREHVARLIAFLESLSGLRSDRQNLIAAALSWAHKGKAPNADWIAMAARRASRGRGLKERSVSKRTLSYRSRRRLHNQPLVRPKRLRLRPLDLRILRMRRI